MHSDLVRVASASCAVRACQRAAERNASLRLCTIAHSPKSPLMVRGTEWFTNDRCDGTLTHVIRGTVFVGNDKTHRTVTIIPGHSHLARRWTPRRRLSPREEPARRARPRSRGSRAGRPSRAYGTQANPEALDVGVAATVSQLGLVARRVLVGRLDQPRRSGGERMLVSGLGADCDVVARHRVGATAAHMRVPRDRCSPARRAKKAARARGLRGPAQHRTYPIDGLTMRDLSAYRHACSKWITIVRRRPRTVGDQRCGPTVGASPLASTRGVRSRADG
jgi:hypothetical protein